MTALKVSLWHAHSFACGSCEWQQSAAANDSKDAVDVTVCFVLSRDGWPEQEKKLQCADSTAHLLRKIMSASCLIKQLVCEYSAQAMD